MQRRKMKLVSLMICAALLIGLLPVVSFAGITEHDISVMKKVGSETVPATEGTFSSETYTYTPEDADYFWIEEDNLLVPLTDGLIFSGTTEKEIISLFYYGEFSPTKELTFSGLSITMKDPEAYCMLLKESGEVTLHLEDGTKNLIKGVSMALVAVNLRIDGKGELTVSCEDHLDGTEGGEIVPAALYGSFTVEDGTVNIIAGSNSAPKDAEKENYYSCALMASSVSVKGGLLDVRAGSVPEGAGSAAIENASGESDPYVSVEGGALRAAGYSMAISSAAPVIADGMEVIASENYDGSEPTTYSAEDYQKYRFIQIGAVDTPCVYPEKLAKPEAGTFMAKFGKKELGKVALSAADKDWILAVGEGAYLTVNAEGKLALTDAPSAWAYANGAFYQTKTVEKTVKTPTYSLWNLLFAFFGTKTTQTVTTTVSTNYYLNTLEAESALPTVFTAVELWKETTRAEGHDYRYIDNGDGTHTGTCKYCGKTVDGDCSYGEDNFCDRCGSYKADAEVAYTVEISTGKQTAYAGFLFFMLPTTKYSTVIKVGGAPVKAVRYSFDGKRWIEGDAKGAAFDTATAPKSLALKVADLNDKEHNYKAEYKDGKWKVACTDKKDDAEEPEEVKE